MQNNQNIWNISISLLHQSKTCRRYCCLFLSRSESTSVAITITFAFDLIPVLNYLIESILDLTAINNTIISTNSLTLGWLL